MHDVIERRILIPKLEIQHSRTLYENVSGTLLFLESLSDVSYKSFTDVVEANENDYSSLAEDTVL